MRIGLSVERPIAKAGIPPSQLSDPLHFNRSTSTRTPRCLSRDQRAAKTKEINIRSDEAGDLPQPAKRGAPFGGIDLVEVAGRLSTLRLGAAGCADLRQRRAGRTDPYCRPARGTPIRFD